MRNPDAHRTKAINVKLRPGEHELLKRAAVASSEYTNEFARNAALARARRILRQPEQL